jgi:hypothetical protein
MRTLAAAPVLFFCTAGCAQDESLTLYTSLYNTTNLFIRGEGNR